MGDPRCLTVTELARACATVAGMSNDRWGLMLMRLAVTADRVSFSGPAGSSGTGDLADGWASVRRGYPRLLWRAWRAGRRPTRGGSRPTVIRLQSI